MSRLPQPGGDKGNWGDILNDFLDQSHNPDGTLKAQDDITDAKAKADSAVQSVNGKIGTTITLAATDVQAEPVGLSDDTKVALDDRYNRSRSQVNTAVILADSYGAFNGGPVDPTAPVTWDSKGVVVWANFFLKQRLRIVKNAGIGGQKMSAFLARCATDVDAYNPGIILGIGGLNDISQGDSASTIITNFTALFKYLTSTQGYRVTWNLITPVSGWTSAQIKILSQVNQWLLAAPEQFPNLTVVDVLSAVLDPTAGISATFRVDTTHLNPAGAIRYGQAMATALSPLLGAATSDIESVNGTTNTVNLISNGRFANPANGLGATWTQLGSNGSTFTQVARTDGVLGNWQRIVSLAGQSTTVRIPIVVASAGLVAGTSKIRFACEVQASGMDLAPAVAKSQRFSISLAFLDGSNTQLATTSSDVGDGTSYDNLLVTTAAGVWRTPDIIVPTGTVTIWANLQVAGAGNFDFDRATVLSV